MAEQPDAAWRKRHFTGILAALLVVFLLSACGYHFSGDGKLALPKNIKTLAITTVDNPTMDSNLDPYLRALIRDELMRRGVHWAPIKDADGLVTIRIINSRTDSWRDGYDRPFTSISLTIEMLVYSAATKNLVWSSGQIGYSETYMYDPTTSQEQLIQNLVQDLGDRITQAF